MSDRTALRDRVQEAIRAGKLPNRAPESSWGGLGCGAACAICGERLSPDEVELELEFATGQDGRGRENYHLHVACFSAWKFERQKLESKQNGMAASGLPGAGGENRLAAHEREVPLERDPS